MTLKADHLGQAPQAFTLMAALMAALVAASLPQSSAVAAEFCYGSYELREGEPYALRNGIWTFDSGLADPLEGWVGAHTRGPDDYEVFRWRTLSDFAADGLPPGAPIIDGQGMLWLGIHEEEANDLCFDCGLGYAPDWSRTLTSPAIPIVDRNLELSFDYFFDVAWDGIHIRVELISGNGGGYELQDLWLDPGDDVGSWDDPLHFMMSSQFNIEAESVYVKITASTFRGGDEDCTYDSEFGAFALDNLQLTGTDYVEDFESDPEWTPGFGGTPDGIHLNTFALDSFGEGWEAWPDCPVSGNVMAFFDQPDGYSDPFREVATSPVIDVSSLGMDQFDGVVVTMDRLVDNPISDTWVRQEFEVRQYPVPCSVTGGDKWSTWKYVDSYLVTGEECGPRTFNLGNPIDGIPELMQVRLGVHVCTACCITYCSGWLKETPLFDNLQICVRGSSPSDVPDFETEMDAPSRVSFHLSGNPVDAGTELVLQVREDGTPVRAELFGPGGRQVETILDQRLDRGTHRIPVGASLTRRGEAGVTFLRVQGPWGMQSEKLVQIR